MAKRIAHGMVRAWRAHVRARPQIGPSAVATAPGVLARFGLAMLLLGVGGCASLGPGSVPRDRIDYISAVAESWKEQTLLNVVRLRYGDAPSFVEVSSLISAYTFQGQFATGGQISSDLTSTIPRSTVTASAGAAYIDHPTISYTPVTGDKFARSLLRPLPPSEIFELIQAGYPSDRVLQLTIRAINGIYNRSGIGGRAREADPQFYPLLDALRRLQQSGAVSIRLEKRAGEEVGVLIFSEKERAEINMDVQFVAKTLNLKVDNNDELTVDFGALQRRPNEIAMLSRSMSEILLEVSVGIEVPDQHVAAGRTAMSGRRPDAENPRDRPLVRILSGTTPPANTYATVHYRDTWYWIDDGDIASKSAFTLLMLFFSLAETGVTPQTPVLTIPAG